MNPMTFFLPGERQPRSQEKVTNAPDLLGKGSKLGRLIDKYSESREKEIHQSYLFCHILRNKLKTMAYLQKKLENS